MKHLLYLVGLLVCAFEASACIWSYGTDLHGKRIQINGLVGDQLVQSLTRHDDRAFWEGQKKLWGDAARKTNDYRSRNDYAVALLHLGETAAAIDVLNAIERERPGLYPTASNLGTAYELAGNDAEAYRWISEGVKRNRKAHDGTEWLHLRILEAKLAVAKDPAWLDTHSVLGLDMGRSAVPQVPKELPHGNDGVPVSVVALRTALQYQLYERLQFVAAPDPYVGDLLFDWANLTAATDVLETARALYAEAVRFGAPRSDVAKQRIAAIDEMLPRLQKKGG